MTLNLLVVLYVKIMLLFKYSTFSEMFKYSILFKYSTFSEMIVSFHIYPNFTAYIRQKFAH